MVSSREGHHTVQRIQPSMPVQAVETFGIQSPLDTHFKSVSCEVAECVRNRDGWRTVLDTSTVEGAKQAKWIIDFSGRKYTKVEQGPVVTFTFGPAQQCFQRHKQPLGRPELYLVRGGDWRGNPMGTVRQHTRPEFWLEHSAISLDRLSEAQRRG